MATLLQEVASFATKGFKWSPNIGILMGETPYGLAQELLSHETVHDVQVSKEKMAVVHSPEDKLTEKIPESCYEHIHSVIEGTLWQTEYQNPGRNAEEHSTGGGNSPIMSLHRRNNRRSELQYHLRK